MKKTNQFLLQYKLEVIAQLVESLSSHSYHTIFM